MFNRDFFWKNTGTVLTTIYDDSKWEKVSYFKESSRVRQENPV